MDRAPLLLLHAATRDRSDFDPFVPALSRFDATCVDLLGHGRAPRAAHYDLPALAAAAVPRAWTGLLYGHSLGGLVALYAAGHLTAPSQAVVLEDPPLFDIALPRLLTRPDAEAFGKLASIIRRRGKDWTAAEWRAAIADWPSGHGTATFGKASGAVLNQSGSFERERPPIFQRGEQASCALSGAKHSGADALTRRVNQIMALDPNLLDAIPTPSFAAGTDALALIRAARCPVVLIAGARERGSALADDDVRLLAGEPNVSIVRAPQHGHYIREAQPALARAALELALAA